MQSNVITKEDLFKILAEWKSSYTIKQNHGSITLLEMEKTYSFKEETLPQQVMLKLGGLYQHLIFDCNIINHSLKMIASVRKDNVEEFLAFRSKLTELEKNWQTTGVI